MHNNIFPRIRNRVRMSSHAIAIQHQTGRPNQYDKERQEIRTRKEEITTSLLRNSPNVYVGNPKESTKMLRELIGEINTGVEYQVIT